MRFPGDGGVTCSYHGALGTILAAATAQKVASAIGTAKCAQTVIRPSAHLASPSHSALTLSRQVISLIFQQLPGDFWAVP